MRRGANAYFATKADILITEISQSKIHDGILWRRLTGPDAQAPVSINTSRTVDLKR